MSGTSLEKKGSKTSQTQTTDAEKRASISSKSESLLEFGEQSSVEEEELIVAEEELPTTTFFDQEYIKTTYEEYKQQQLKEEPLFAEILTLDNDQKNVIEDTTSADEPSILVTGFGIRNLESLQDALREQEKKFRCICKYDDSSIEEGASSLSSISSKGPSTSSKTSTETETDLSAIKSDFSAQRLQLQYLLGLEAETEEEYVPEQPAEEVEEEEYAYSTSKSIRAAQRYLRVHRIFDFFQIIIAHLLGATPENPIDFILVHLNKCLCYRSGLGKPPLLYEEKHIEQLYKLMDRMNTGFIEEEQYHKAMTTLGICQYNKKPPMLPDGLITKEFFIQEALECETAIFDDLVRRRWMGGKPPSEPKSLDIISRRDSGPYFIPPDLLLRERPYRIQELERIVEGEGDNQGEGE